MSASSENNEVILARPSIIGQFQSVRNPRIIVAMVVCVWALTTYRGLSDHPWSYDDYDHVVKAERVLESPATLLSPDSKEPSRVLHHLYFLLVYVLFGESVAAYHILNIVLHLINVVLCYLLARQLTRDEATSLTAAFLFAINVSAFEAIYWIAASATLMGAAFAQTTVLLVLRSNSLRSSVWASLSYLACCLCYESHIAILIPLVWIWWSRRPSIPVSTPVKLALAAVLFVLADGFVFSTGDAKVSANEIVIGFHVVENVGRFIGRLYLNAHFAPAGWSGSVPFDMPETYHLWYTLTGWLIAAGLVLASRKSPCISLLLVWIIATALPSSMSIEHRLFPRYWYLPSVASSTLTAIGCVTLFNRVHFGRYARVAVAVLALVLLTSTYVKSRYYEGRYLMNTANFHRDHLADPDRAIPLYHRAASDYDVRTGLLYGDLAYAYWMTDDRDETLQMLRTVADVDPAYALTLSDQLVTKELDVLAINLLAPLLEDETWGANASEKAAPIEYKRGNFEAARRHYQASTSLDRARALTGLGLVEIELGNRQIALEHLNEALRISPERRETRQTKARLLSGLERHDEAIEIYSSIAREMPESWEANLEWGTALLRTGQAERSHQPLEAAVRLAPDDANVLLNAAVANQTTKRIDRARELFTTLLEVSPGHPQAAAIQKWLSRNARP
jgi:tetratricopeptide (TPR) repeat protein